MMSYRGHIWELFWIAIIATDPHGVAFAGGYMMPYQTARGLAMSNALTASVEDPSAVFYNPAALGEIEGNGFISSGLYLHSQNSVENSGRKATNKHDDHFLASLFANYHIPNSDFSIGLGTYTPFGLGINYETDFTRFATHKSEL